MTDAELEATWALAQALWPRAVEPGAEMVQAAWRPMLARRRARDVAEAMAELAQRSERFPTLAALTTAVAERQELAVADRDALERERRPKLAPPEPTVSRRLAAFDRAQEAQRAQLRAEVLMFAQRYGVDGGFTEARLAEVERAGPHEERARRIVAGDLQPLEGIEGFGVSLIGCLTPSYAPTAVPKIDARRIVDEWTAEPRTWPKERIDALSGEVRAAVRSEILRRRANASSVDAVRHAV